MIHQNSERKSNGRAATTAMVGKRDDVHMRRCCNLAANRADGAVCEGVPVMVEDGGRGDRWAGGGGGGALSKQNVCVVGPRGALYGAYLNNFLVSNIFENWVKT